MDEVLAKYLDLSPEADPEFFFEIAMCEDRYCPVYYCTVHDTNACLKMSYELIPCNPFEPGNDKWLPKLIKYKYFRALDHLDGDYEACINGYAYGKDSDPVIAIVKAMMTADPEFAKEMGCE